MTIRKTRQKAVIRNVLESANRPLGTDEIFAAAHADVGSLGMATVYRAIRSLLDEGWLTAVEVPGRNPLYERSGKGHHHHFLCGACGRVYELDGCSTEIRGELPRGFVTTGHDVTFYGACADCNSGLERLER